MKDEVTGTTDHGGTPEGRLDQGFLTDIGTQIRTLRKAQDLTVQQLADQAHISRRLLTQIELGQANPSLVTMTRIARQLGTELTSLITGSPSRSPVEVRTGSEHVLVWSSDAGSTAHLLQAADEKRSADLWLWKLAAGDVYRGQADPARSHELFYVLAGSLTLSADATTVTLATGASARLLSDRPYTYTNEGVEPAEFIRTVALGR